MTKLPIYVLLSGPAGAGKSTFAKAVIKALANLGSNYGDDTNIMSFAQSLKWAASKAEEGLGVPRDLRTDWNDYDQKKAARALLVELGRHVRRLHPTAFPDSLHRCAMNAGQSIVVVDDWRYLNEYKFLAERVRTVIPIKILREGHAPANEEERASLAEIDAVFSELPACLVIPEWKNGIELAESALGVAKYLHGIYGAQSTVRTVLGK